MKIKILAILCTILICFGIVCPLTVFADEGSSLVTIKLEDFNTDETDNITIPFQHKKTRKLIYFTFTKANGWQDEQNMPYGEYKILSDNISADNQMGIILEAGSVTIAESNASSLGLKVKKVQDNSFFIKFLRNNAVTLILLIISSIVYFVLRQRRLNGIPSKPIQFGR